MQQYGSTNKSLNYPNATENKFDTGNLFTNGENHRGKTPPGEFQITTLKNPLLSITNSYKYKESYQTLWSIPKYQPTIESLPQYPSGLVLYWQSSSSMHESQYVTNTSNLKKMLATKFFSSSTMKIRKLIGYKTLWHKDAVASSERIMNQVLSTCILLCDGL